MKVLLTGFGGQINGFIPGAGQVVNGASYLVLTAIDRDVAGYLRNRNSFGDAVVPPGAGLSIQTDWLYGGPLI